VSETSYSKDAPKSYETGLQTAAPTGAATVPPPRPWTPLTLLIVVIACVGFAYDTYTLLVMPLVAQPALHDLEHLEPFTDSGFAAIRNWAATIIFVSAACGGVFGLLGGYLTDRFGRQTVLLGSILLSTAGGVGSGFATDIPALHLSGGWVLLICRCAAFIGVCVEFVAAVAWLAELFPNPKQRERVLGYTQVFASLGGMLVAVAYYIINQTYQSLPAIYGGHAQWRYALISAAVVALPLLLIRPFLPESPVWKQKRAAGTLRRPSILELFKPEYRRTTIVTALLFTCSFGVAFGAIQMTPQLVPGLVPDLKLMGPKRIAYEAAQKPEKLAKLKKDADDTAAALEKKPDDAALADKADKAKKVYGMALGASKDEGNREGLRKDIESMDAKQESERQTMQLYQETGGLIGRFVLAFLATVIVSRRLLLWVFQIPALLVVPLVFFFPAAGKLDPSYNLTVCQLGIAAASFLVIAQFSFWGNYLPRVYPTHLRGTGESFAANVGARMFGTSAQGLTSYIMAPYVIAALFPLLDRTANTAYAAAATAALLLLLGVILTSWLPQPREEVAQE
jgi:MFS family permease